jgi:deazaflavin-dependent oxidoreductase (nitroreductase family)
MTVQKLAAARWASWFLSRTLRLIDALFLRMSQNRVSLTSYLTGLPVVVVTTVGSKSGLERTTPLVGIPDGQSVILVASNFGSQSHPAWYYNLRARPQARLELDGEAREFIAREPSAEEYERCWRKAVELYAGFEAYRQRAGKRRIPILVLSPRNLIRED